MSIFVAETYDDGTSVAALVASELSAAVSSGSLSSAMAAAAGSESVLATATVTGVTAYTRSKPPTAAPTAAGVGGADVEAGVSSATANLLIVAGFGAIVFFAAVGLGWAAWRKRSKAARHQLSRRMPPVGQMQLTELELHHGSPHEQLPPSQQHHHPAVVEGTHYDPNLEGRGGACVTAKAVEIEL